MKNKWLGYLASLLITLAGIVFIVAGKIGAGIFLILVGIGGAILKFKLMNHEYTDKKD
ncbi:MAG: hypothetical protein QM534_00280 [Sediminibacterium sp.]|nr:hypothetical protein [Sediminibacterium sp.]